MFNQINTTSRRLIMSASMLEAWKNDRRSALVDNVLVNDSCSLNEEYNMEHDESDSYVLGYN